MRSIRLALTGVTISAVFAVTLSLAGSACGQEKVIHTFNNANGFDPIAGMIIDDSGNLYGSTFYGGKFGAGAAFKLTPKDSGWAETVLYSFNQIGTGGFWPNAKMIFDSHGNLYGTTFLGGEFGAGEVFELIPTPTGSWGLNTLHSFGSGGDGTFPHGGLLLDEEGNLYGTTAGGGANSDGMVYELTPNGDGSYGETVLHSFSGADGANPYSGLVMVGGKLYGTTYSGGSSSACTDGCGTVFAVSPSGSGGWSETVAHSFNNDDGANPDGGLIVDASGNLYGAASQGALGNFGVIFELTPANGGWEEVTLHNFNFQGGDGVYPIAPLTFDASGNLYGATEEGGTYDSGAVYELTPTAGGGWSERVVYSFTVGLGVTNHPAPGIVFDDDGNLYGTTLSGGYFGGCLGGCGGVFEITP
ncbi:MAG: choice-of-anchor tandem repeat GloVer-containing protein [Candidatus Sulfotelmatobacter sp.]